jgi:hypothetical protein
MATDNEKYKKIIEMLRNSRPELIRPEEIEDEVIKRIRRQKSPGETISAFIESLFGWVYVSWVRRSLIGAVTLLVAIFVYQQASILKQVNNISKRMVITGIVQASASSAEFDKKLTLYKISTKFSGDREIKISENQLEELLDSYQNLQVKYKDLIRIIEENPELKKYIENKLDEERNNKPDI